MALWWEHETAGHTTSTVRKQRETNTGAQLTPSFLSSLRPLARGMVLPMLRLGLLILIRQSLSHVQRLASQVVLDPVAWAVSINLQTRRVNT